MKFLSISAAEGIEVDSAESIEALVTDHLNSIRSEEPDDECTITTSYFKIGKYEAVRVTWKSPTGDWRDEDTLVFIGPFELEQIEKVGKPGWLLRAEKDWNNP